MGSLESNLTDAVFSNALVYKDSQKHVKKDNRIDIIRSLSSWDEIFGLYWMRWNELSGYYTLEQLDKLEAGWTCTTCDHINFEQNIRMAIKHTCRHCQATAYGFDTLYFL